MVFRFVRYALLFTACFILSGLALNMAIRAVSPPPYMGLLSEKISAFEQNGDRIEILFIGTSRSFRQINAPLIERYLQERQCGSGLVFNMGIPNLTWTELDYVLSRIDLSHAPQLRLVVIEEPMPALRPDINRLMSERVRYFSDWSGTRSRLQDIQSAQEPLYKKAARAALAGAGFAYEAANVGHLSRLIFPELYAARSESDPELAGMPDDWMPTRGYWSFEGEGHYNDAVRAARDSFLSQLDQFDAQLQAQRSKTPESLFEPKTARLTLYERLIDSVRIQNAGPPVALLFPPLPERVGENHALIEALEARNTDATILHYNDPQAHSVFWDKDLWFDAGHLNDQGAEIFSKDIAARLCETLRSAPQRERGV